MCYGKLLCCLAAILLAVSGCSNGFSSIPVPFVQTDPVGPNNGTDSCWNDAEALYKTGNFFGPSIVSGAVAGAAVGGAAGLFTGGNFKAVAVDALIGAGIGAAGGYWAALQAQHENDEQLEATVSNDLTTENSQIDATQIAFNQDMDCRFQQAQSIKDAYVTGQITHDQAAAQMAQVQSWAQRDVGIGQKISDGIQSRSKQFDTAATNLDAPPPPPPEPIDKPAVARREVALLLRPDPAAPELAQLTRREPVTITGSDEGYAVVQTDDGLTGYVPLYDLSPPGSYHRIYIHHAEPSGGSQVQQLAGSNAARGDAYAQSVSVSQSAVAGSGFQLAS